MGINHYTPKTSFKNNTYFGLDYSDVLGFAQPTLPLFLIMQIYCSKTGRTRIPPIEVGNSASFPARWSLLCSKPHKNELFLDLERFVIDDEVKQKQEAIAKINQLTPSGWEQVLELLGKI